MKTTDSRDCRNCHHFDFMDLRLQENRSVEQHQAAQHGVTCIDCHRGIAHELPEDGFEADLAELLVERNGGVKEALPPGTTSKN